MNNTFQTITQSVRTEDQLFSVKDQLAAQNKQISIQNEVIDYLLQVSCKKIIFSDIRPCMN
jgi:hypothetical protein